MGKKARKDTTTEQLRKLGKKGKRVDILFSTNKFFEEHKEQFRCPSGKKLIETILEKLADNEGGAKIINDIINPKIR